jgi:UDP-2-acetamido-3-amino-2,3-dideoxy-glucuronate N-acetyltransferase
MEHKFKFAFTKDAEIGEGTVIHDLVNLYKCKIGKNCKIASFVYIEEDVTVGDNCKIKPFVFIPTGVTIGDNVFIGPNVTFTNDRYPKAQGEWQLIKTTIKNGVSLGANSTILPGITIENDALVGAGAVVTKNVPEKAIVAGNPAKIIGYREKNE